MKKNFHIPTTREMKAARKAFEEYEPRDLFYKAATELVDLSLKGITSLTLSEALGILLQTWNSAYYRYNKFDEHHFAKINYIVGFHSLLMLKFRERSIESFCEKDEIVINKIFFDFEEVLGPVGAAKCLHLLAPRFFPLWDRAIARAYGVALTKRGSNSVRYSNFMKIARDQCKSISEKYLIEGNLLKAIDEYNYCKHTKDLI